MSCLSFFDISTMMKDKILFISNVFAALLLDAVLWSASANECPGMSEKWQDFGGDFCYLVERNRQVEWIDAVYNCFNEGGSLASFHSADEVQRVANRISNETRRYYIGLRIHYDGSLEWVDKSAFDVRNWSPGEPNSPDEKCVEMYYDTGKWNDVSCRLKIGYICSSLKGRPLSSGPRKVCPQISARWKDFGGESCYIIERQRKLAWDDALDRCRKEGGSLASFNSIEEISAVLQHTKDDSEATLHIGLRQNNWGTYKWADGSRLELDYWHSREPSNSEKLCGEMDTKSGYWKDVSCETNSGYICSSRKAVCGGDIHSDGGMLFSPNFPEPYASNENCLWKITVPENQQVALQFQGIDMERQFNCRFDFVEVLDGHDPGSQVLGKFCEANVSHVIHSSKNKMAVRFVSDISGEGRGFAAKFTKAVVTEEDMVAETGILRSPNSPGNYGPGDKSTWRITVPEGRKIALNFQSFAVQESTNCLKDFVQIHDGHENQSHFTGRFCGWHLPNGILSTGNKMTVVFKSDLSVEMSGFVAEFYSVSDCGGNIAADNGTFSVPNYSRNYEGNMECTWKIKVPQNHQVVLQFQTFDLQDTIGCATNYVKVRDGHRSGDPILADLCGPQIPRVIRSSANVMTVKFVSTSTERRSSFTAVFAKGTTCGEDIVAKKGVIQSPNFPDNYGPGEKCIWNIAVPGNHKISLKFLTFDIKYTEICNDLVEVHDGNEFGSHPLGFFCGSVVPNGIVSTGNTMTIRFESDLFEQGTGFSAEFETDTCGGDITSDNGAISSPNYPGNYRRNEKCTWKITVPAAYQVNLQFQTFDLEYNGDCIFDFVEVYDGHESSSPLLGKFCGSDIPEIILSSSNKMSVSFVTDESKERLGFNATFKKDSNVYEHMRNELLELPALVLQHKLPKVKEHVIMKSNRPPKKSKIGDVLGEILKP